MRTTIGFLLAAAFLVFPIFAGAEGCVDSADYRLLDFWLGEWNVYLNGHLAGTNRIEKILDGCAVLEHWKDVEGNEGKSLFYRDPATGSWKQVWVTDTGSMKEKSWKSTAPDGSVLFQGEVAVPGGKRVQDRTTLYPAGRVVRQVIEHSTDGGKTWRVVFEGDYRRKVDPTPK
jgi:hypothetical protein